MDERGFQFPCDIPIKAMGRAEGEFADRVRELIGRHVDVDANQVRLRSSGEGRFQSVTVNVHVESREQMEAIYADLHACDDVLWTL
ncbi:MAG: DUF493 domain-containing protein [Pseudomonadota bacterium]